VLIATKLIMFSLITRPFIQRLLHESQKLEEAVFIQSGTTRSCLDVRLWCNCNLH